MADVFVVTAKDVRERMTLPNEESVNAAITSGLRAAHSFFEGALNSPITSAVAAQRDVFFVSEDVIPSVGDMFSLRLRRMFVKASTLVVKYASTRKGALDAAASVMDAEDYILDAEKGILKIEAEAFNDNYIAVTYNAGFDDDGSTGTKVELAPDWLKQAILAFLPSVLVAAQGNEDSAKYLGTILEVRKSAATQVDMYKRESALQFTPLH